RVQGRSVASAAAADQPEADRVGARRVRPGHHRRERKSKRGRRGRLDEIATRRRSGELVSAHACPPSSTSRYWELSLVMAERNPLRLSCSSTARTTRNPANRALVCHQMLFGLCGYRRLPRGADPRRAALRASDASSSHEPPRETCGNRWFPGSSTGPTVPGWTRAEYTATYRSRNH